MRASHSEILCYLDCRKKHHFRYRLRLPVINGQAVELDKGSAVHTGMEHLVKAPNFGGPDGWREAQVIAAKDLRSRRVESTASECAAVQAAVRAGHAYLMSIECDEVLGAERQIRPDFNGWTPNGTIDFIWRDRYGVLHIDDWKTCKELGEPTVGVPDGQTALYAYWALKEFGVDSVHAGRVYLRTVEPDYEVTKKGTFSLQNKISYDDYRRFIASVEYGPSPALEDDEKAQAKFGQWWRADTDILSLRLAEAVLKDQREVALEITENRTPVANRRPKMCIRCEYLTECVDQMIHGDFDPTFDESTDGSTT